MSTGTSDPNYLDSVRIFSYGLRAQLSNEAELADGWEEVYATALGHPRGRAALSVAMDFANIEFHSLSAPGSARSQLAGFRLANKYRMNKAAQQFFSEKDPAFRDKRPLWMHIFFLAALALPLPVFLTYELKLLKSINGRAT